MMYKIVIALFLGCLHACLLFCIAAFGFWTMM